jgi:hypothetical protein
LAQDANQTEKKPPDKAIEEAAENKTGWKDCQSNKPADKFPTNDGGDVNTTEEEINTEWKEREYDEPAKTTPTYEETGTNVTNENEAEWQDTTSGKPADESPTADGNAATTRGESNSTGCLPIDEATVVVKEECFEVDDALLLPAQGMSRLSIERTPSSASAKGDSITPK